MMMSFAKKFALFSVLYCFVGGASAVPVVTHTGEECTTEEWNNEKISDYLKENGWKEPDSCGGDSTRTNEERFLCFAHHRFWGGVIIFYLYCDLQEARKPVEQQQLGVVKIICAYGDTYLENWKRVGIWNLDTIEKVDLILDAICRKDGFVEPCRDYNNPFRITNIFDFSKKNTYETFSYERSQLKKYEELL